MNLSVVILVCLIAAAGAASVTWALTQVLVPPADPLTEATYTYATVKQGEVGSSFSTSVSASWQQASTGTNLASGTVTTIDVSPGTIVDQGTVVYTVDLKPVFIAQGNIPAFRTIELASKGQDVEQLQQMLADLGFYYGDMDGDAGSGTVSAIKSWQKSLSLEPTGAVAAGDIIFLPHLPARIKTEGELLKVGASLQGGEEVLEVLPQSPSFRLAMTPAQASQIAQGTRVVIHGPGVSDWEARTGAQLSTDSEVVVSLEPTGDSAICGTECNLVDLSGEVPYSASIITVEPVAGDVIPTAAILTGEGGSAYVVDEEGDTHDIAITASARGMSAITGLTPGMSVRLPSGPLK